MERRFISNDIVCASAATVRGKLDLKLVAVKREVYPESYTYSGRCGQIHLSTFGHINQLHLISIASRETPDHDGAKREPDNQRANHH